MHHPVVAVIAKQHDAHERRQRRAAGLAEGIGDLCAAFPIEIGKGAARKSCEIGKRAADILAVAVDAFQDVAEDQLIIGAGHAVCRACGDDEARKRAQIADFAGGQAMVRVGQVLGHIKDLSRTGSQGAA
jgi:hypothetical protein